LLRVGVLALQGAFAEHVHVLGRLGADPVLVKKPGQLDALAGLIIPGGESGVISRLMEAYGFFPVLRERCGRGFPVYGTCAGLILLAAEVENDGALHTVGGMHMVVRRNAFGRQLDSFEHNLKIPCLGPEAFPGVFIRAPLIKEVGPGVHPLARLPDGSIVAAEQGGLLATAFHPELTRDTRVHRYFLSRCGA
jgi:5'-phosphate synthase pdxT subunit